MGNGAAYVLVGRPSDSRVTLSDSFNGTRSDSDSSEREAKGSGWGRPHSNQRKLHADLVAARQARGWGLPIPGAARGRAGWVSTWGGATTHPI